MTEKQKLALLLHGIGAQLLGFTPGEDASSDEEMARAIRKSIIGIRRANPDAFQTVDLSY